ncbi:MAG: hypothetical protein PHG00_15515 [Methylococcales bacterium]|nr:hypothetical protein [Methylococcales bacterium]
MKLSPPIKESSPFGRFFVDIVRDGVVGVPDDVESQEIGERQAVAGFSDADGCRAVVQIITGST